MLERLFTYLIPKIYAATPDLINVPSSATQPATFPELANRLLSVLTSLAYPLAFVAVLYTAFILINSGGLISKEGKSETWVKAKKNISYLAIGIFLIVFATIILRIFLQSFCPTDPHNFVPAHDSNGKAITNPDGSPKMVDPHPGESGCYAVSTAPVTPAPAATGGGHP